MSKIYPKFNVEIHNNKVVFEDRQSFDNHLVPYEGKQMRLVIESRKKQRSNKQNGYFHGVVLRMIADEMGETDDKVKEMLRYMFLRTEMQIRERIYEYSRSTADLSTREFEEFCEQCRLWGNDELGIYIPLPNEATY